MPHAFCLCLSFLRGKFFVNAYLPLSFCFLSLLFFRKIINQSTVFLPLFCRRILRLGGNGTRPRNRQGQRALLRRFHPAHLGKARRASRRFQLLNPRKIGNGNARATIRRQAQQSKIIGQLVLILYPNQNLRPPCRVYG